MTTSPLRKTISDIINSLEKKSRPDKWLIMPTRCRLHCKSSYENWDAGSNNVDQNTLYISLQNTLWWFYHFFLSSSLFKSWSVSTPWRREACTEPRDHRPQQPPDGGQAHHWEAPRRQCKNSFLCVAAENRTKRVTSSFVSSVVNEDPALNIKVQVIVAVGIFFILWVFGF